MLSIEELNCINKHQLAHHIINSKEFFRIELCRKHVRVKDLVSHQELSPAGNKIIKEAQKDFQIKAILPSAAKISSPKEIAPLFKTVKTVI